MNRVHGIFLFSLLVTTWAGGILFDAKKRKSEAVPAPVVKETKKECVSKWELFAPTIASVKNKEEREIVSYLHSGRYYRNNCTDTMILITKDKDVYVCTDTDDITRKACSNLP